jgi:adenine-specific DNA-methyltransferase
MREKQPMTVEHWSQLPAMPKDPRVAAVLDKMAATGISLQKCCKGQMYSGIATGLNAAFVLDQRTRDLLVAGDPQSAVILKPFLEARDIKPWRVEWQGLWLIYTYSGIDIQHYPTVLDYLHTFKLRLEQRRGKFAWYELSCPCENSKTAMEQPKLIYPGISNLPKIALDDLGRYYVGNNVYFIPGTDRYLQGVLGSRVLWFYLANTASSRKQGYYRLSMRNMKNLPIPTPAGAERVGIAHLVEHLSEEHCPDRLNLETELNDRIAYLYGLTTEEELHIVEGLPLAPLTAESEDV